MRETVCSRRYPRSSRRPLATTGASMIGTPASCAAARTFSEIGSIARSRSTPAAQGPHQLRLALDDRADAVDLVEPGPWVAAPEAHGHGHLARTRREQRLTEREPSRGRRRVGADEDAMTRAVLEQVLLATDPDRLVRFRKVLLPGERVA